MLEKWRAIAAFPNYRVSNLGQVESIKTGRALKQTINQHGHLKIKMMQNGVAHTRQVNQLVAQHFLPDPPRKDFDSVIHLDGDKQNCQASNLAWRPRYFAIRYHQQFETPMWSRSKIPVIDAKTGKIYKSAQEAATANGLIFTELITAASHHTYVWPTYQKFEILID